MKEENFLISLAITRISMKFSRKMWLMIMLKVTKTELDLLSLSFSEKYISVKTEGLGTGAQFKFLPAFLMLKLLQQLKSSPKFKRWWNDGVCETLEHYNSTEKRKVLIVFHNRIGDKTVNGKI